MGQSRRERWGRWGAAAAAVTALLTLTLLDGGCSAAGAAGAEGTLKGTWARLPRGPVSADGGFDGVWTGRAAFIASRRVVRVNGREGCRTEAALWYPDRNDWRTLHPPSPPSVCAGGGPYLQAVWTGRQVLLWGSDLFSSYTPGTGAWRRLPRPAGALAQLIGGTGLVAWTGREMVVWGGGCCANDVGVGGAYNPTTRRWRRLATAPLPPMNGPVGVWSGHELIISGGFRINPNPHEVRRGAAYNPRTNRWRRIAPRPDARGGAEAVVTGSSMLLVADVTDASATGKVRPRLRPLEYAPDTDTWRYLTAMPEPRFGAGWVRDGHRVLGWGGATTRDGPDVRTGLAYDTRTDSWSRIPAAPIPGWGGPVALWTGRQMVVWGGRGVPSPVSTGAVFTPASLAARAAAQSAIVSQRSRGLRGAMTSPNGDGTGIRRLPGRGWVRRSPRTARASLTRLHAERRRRASNPEIGERVGHFLLPGMD